MPQLVLASTSPYRRELLTRLQLPFETCSPEIDETPLAKETPNDLVLRLSQAKAKAVSKDFPNAWIIGGDQVAVCDGTILGKPGNRETAIEQLTQISGETVTFLTGLCLYKASINNIQVEIIPFSVHFKRLNRAQIERYVDKEPAFNCAGSFKSEGFGIALTSGFEGDDPTALIGLPLIRLTQMLEAAGLDVI